MSSVIIAGDTSGTVTLQAPSAAGSTVINLPATSMNIGNGGGNISTNTAFGSSALAANTTGIAGTAIGASALAVNTSGDQNTAVGQTVLGSNTTGSYNTAVGRAALQANTTASYNTAAGYQALYSNTGAGNTAFGAGAGYSNTTGNVTAVGFYALNANTTGANNTGVGDSALRSNTTGASNVAMGVDSLRSNTTASNNTAVGYQAGYSNTANAGGTFVGYQAGYNATGSAGNNYNTLIGYNAGNAITTGVNNTVLGCYNGNQGGLNITTSTGYIVLSDGAGNPRGIFDNNGIYLLNLQSVVASRPEKFQVAGNPGVHAAMLTYQGATTTQGHILFRNPNGEIGQITTSGSSTTYSTSSDYRLKENIAPMSGALGKVAQLKPCTYTWKVDGSEGQGFIAHELQEIIPDAVHGTKDEVDENGNPKYQGVDTSFLVATLTAAIQELNAKFEAYKEAHP